MQIFPDVPWHMYYPINVHIAQYTKCVALQNNVTDFPLAKFYCTAEDFIPPEKRRLMETDGDSETNEG